MEKSSRNYFKNWTEADIELLHQLARENTPTRVIGMKLGRTVDAVQAKAQELGISLRPVNNTQYRTSKKQPLKYQMLVIWGVFIGSTLVLYYWLMNLSIKYKLFQAISSSEVITIFLTVASLAILAQVFMMYLKGDKAFNVSNMFPYKNKFVKNNNYSSIILDQKVRSLSKELANLQQQIMLGHSEQQIIDSEERNKLLSELNESITARLLEEFEQRYASSVKSVTYIDQARKRIDSSSNRLLQEIEVLSRRANLNLVIGAVTTCLAVGLLTYMVLLANVSFSEITTLLSHYIPRITTVIFIEVFAFFFLKLYKSNLAEIKYYQNELTNLSIVALSMETIFCTEDMSIKSDAIKQLLLIDRNAGERGALSRDDLKPGIKDITDVIEKVVKIVTPSKN